MLIAHLPAGYLLTKFIQKHSGTTEYMRLGLIASILPDIDMLYLGFMRHSQPHGGALTHTPMLWLFIMLFSFGYAATFIKDENKYNSTYLMLLIFFANIFLHMLLDSFSSPIRWVFPFYNYSFELVHVPARHSWWIWDFVMHWSFLVEIAIVISALCVFLKIEELRIIRIKECPTKYL